MGNTKYFDKNGKEILSGCIIRFESGQEEIVYETIDGELGIDATNKKWIENGKAVPCEYGIYTLTKEDMRRVEVVEYQT